MKINWQTEPLDLELKICDLISSAKFFVDQTEKINSIYNKTKKDKKVFTIHSVLYFSYVLSVFKTLFEIKSQKPREQSFEKWRSFNKATSDEENDFQTIMILYEKSNFKKFRNKLTDHRDYENAGDVWANFSMPINDDHLQTAMVIIDKLEKHIKKYFSEDGVRYSFNMVYQRDMDNFIELLKHKYEN